MAEQMRSRSAVRDVADPVLEVSDVAKDFGGIVALDGVDLAIEDGEIVCVIGPNGAGKSTLFNCITGIHPVSRGEIYLDGEEISGRYTAEIVQKGLSRTFQLARVFPELTVRENMVVNQNHADENLLGTVASSTDDETGRRIEELLSFVGLTGLADEPAGDLSTGQKKLLNLSSTLLRDPDVVLLDEPTAGVNPGLIDDITDSILELNEAGSTFLVIEHDMDVVRKIGDYAYVLANGTNLTDGRPGEALEDPRVLEAYFGE